jgi:pantetheine-phosphate adenylyltransferase
MVSCMKVCLGGTFSSLHKGHKTLLRKAFQVAGPDGLVFIGVTSSAMAKKKGITASFNNRKQVIEQFLSAEKVLTQALIKPLKDAYGPALDGDFDAIVVSPETRSTAEEINEKRRKLRKKPLRIVVVPFVLSDDRKPISSSRIRQGEIDEKGTLLPQE